MLRELCCGYQGQKDWKTLHWILLHLMTDIPISVTNKMFCVLHSIALLRVMHCKQQNQTTVVSTETDLSLL